MCWFEWTNNENGEKEKERMRRPLDTISDIMLRAHENCTSLYILYPFYSVSNVAYVWLSSIYPMAIFFFLSFSFSFS